MGKELRSGKFDPVELAVHLEKWLTSGGSNAPFSGVRSSAIGPNYLDRIGYKVYMRRDCGDKKLCLQDDMGTSRGLEQIMLFWRAEDFPGMGRCAGFFVVHNIGLDNGAIPYFREAFGRRVSWMEPKARAEFIRKFGKIYGEPRIEQGVQEYGAYIGQKAPDQPSVIGDRYEGVSIITPILDVPLADGRVSPIMFECGELGIARPSRSVIYRVLAERKKAEVNK